MLKTVISESRFDEPLTCKVLIIHQVIEKKAKSFSAHEHSYFQLEMIQRGRVTAECEGMQALLEAGDLFLIPPKVKHRFIYSDSVSQFYSFKFKCEPAVGKLSTGLIALGPRGQALKDCLFKLSVDFESTSAIPSPSAVSPELVEHLLGALLTLESQRLVDDPIQTLSSQVTSLVSASQGKAWTIQKLAEQLDYSPGHLSKVFQREKKQALKDYLDEERGKAAQSLLGYSDLSVIDIALRLEFPDSMSFSHFFKRRYAQSPRDYRKEFLKKG